MSPLEGCLGGADSDTPLPLAWPGPGAQYLRAINLLHAMEETNAVRRVPQVEALLVNKLG